MKTKNYNHMYDIAFSVDTTEEDPAEVSEKELLLALLRRIANTIEEAPSGYYGLDVGGVVGHCDTYEKIEPEDHSWGEED